MIEKLSWFLYTKEYADLITSGRVRFIYFSHGDCLVTDSGIIRIDFQGGKYYGFCELIRVCLTSNFFLILGFNNLVVRG